MPVKSGVIGQYLYAGPDDERHEKEVQEMADAKPDREARCDDAGTWRRARIADQKRLDFRHRPQRLCHSNASDKKNEGDRRRPEQAEPSFSEPNTGNDTRLRRHPVIEQDAIVCRGEARLDRIVERLCGTDIFHDIGPLNIAGAKVA